LLDNMVKYAPANSDASIHLEEQEDRINVTFRSLGPRIEPAERGKIFLPKYRATAARALDSSGLGIGLGTAKEISDALGLGLAVQQEIAEDTSHPSLHWTTFQFHLARAGKSTRH